MGVPEEEQVIVEGMHQGIAMKVKCGTCGRAMTMKSGVVRGGVITSISIALMSRSRPGKADARKNAFGKKS